MEIDNKKIYKDVSAYADKVLDGIDPQKTQVSFQLEKLKPCMEQLAKEFQTTVDDIFIRYMDEATNASIETEKKFQSTMGHMDKYGDPIGFEQF